MIGYCWKSIRAGVLVGFMSAGACLAASVVANVDSPEFIRSMNIGKAHLENRESTKAIEEFQAALRVHPQSLPALRNLARAFLLARMPDQAHAVLKDALRIEPPSATTEYLAGLTCMRLSKTDEAITHFEAAVRLDSRTPALRFQLANAYAVADWQAKAVEQLQETVRLDPLHAAAHYKLAMRARERGDSQQHQDRMREFTRLRKLFGDESRSPEALETCIHTRPEGLGPMAAMLSAPDGVNVRFVDVTEDVFPTKADREAVATCIIDIDEHGYYSVFSVGANGQTYLMRFSEDRKFSWTPLNVTVAGDLEVAQCVVGDFYNDVPKDEKYEPDKHARNDVLLVGANGVRLLKRTGSTTFEDVTDHAGLTPVRGRRAAWVDYEHDGDVDLIIANDAGLSLWQNNGDGRFSDVTGAVGLQGLLPVVDVAAADLDRNVAVDIVVARGASPTQVMENRRAGQFAKMAEPPGPWPAAHRLLIDDLNNDGVVDAVLVGAHSVEFLMSGDSQRRRIEIPDITCMTAALLDFDNDGRLDLALAGHRALEKDGSAIRLWRNSPEVRWVEATESIQLASNISRINGILAADLDADADTDMLLVASDSTLRFLRNDGGDRNGQFKLRLQGTKSNPAGIGSHVELRASDYWLSRSITGVFIELGLGGRTKLDSLQTVWTNGIVESRIDVVPGARPLTIVEKNVSAGSCPFLYAWDGQRYRFVTDLLGNSPLGLLLRKDQILPADPDEIVSIGDDRRFSPFDGSFRIQITSEFREVLFLDHVELLVVDRPPNHELHPTDKLMPPPFPKSELWDLEHVASVRSALGNDGVDRTDSLRAIDGVFASPTNCLPPPYRGMCHPLALTLDFGAIDAASPLVLVMTGWLQYGDGSTNIALSQNATAEVIAPTLEAEIGSGEWTPVNVVVGMPAGKTKTILCDLTDKLPQNTRRLRLTSTFEIRWDRIALLQRRSAPSQVIHRLAPSTASLRWRGFSELKSRAPDHPTTPDYEVVFPRPPWRNTPQGWCTRYGDVVDLITRKDNELVLLNGGDALSVEFGVDALPAPVAGRTREYFLFSVGWDKDADHNVINGETVEPLPTSRTVEGIQSEDGPAVTHASDETDWRVRYNTRWVSWNQFSGTDP